MKIVIDILIGLRKLRDDTAADHLSKVNSPEVLTHLNGVYRGLNHAIAYIEQALQDEQDKD